MGGFSPDCPPSVPVPCGVAVVWGWHRQSRLWAGESTGGGRCVSEDSVHPPSPGSGNMLVWQPWKLCTSRNMLVCEEQGWLSKHHPWARTRLWKCERWEQVLILVGQGFALLGWCCLCWWDSSSGSHGLLIWPCYSAATTQQIHCSRWRNSVCPLSLHSLIYIHRL